MVRQNLARLLAPVWRRLRLLVSRGVVRLSDDGRKLQVVQLDMLAGETAAVFFTGGQPVPFLAALPASISEAKSRSSARSATAGSKASRLTQQAPGFRGSCRPPSETKPR